MSQNFVRGQYYGPRTNFSGLKFPSTENFMVKELSIPANFVKIHLYSTLFYYFIMKLKKFISKYTQTVIMKNLGGFKFSVLGNGILYNIGVDKVSGYFPIFVRKRNPKLENRYFK